MSSLSGASGVVTEKRRSATRSACMNHQGYCIAGASMPATLHTPSRINRWFRTQKAGGDYSNRIHNYIGTYAMQIVIIHVVADEHRNSKITTGTVNAKAEMRLHNCLNKKKRIHSISFSLQRPLGGSTVYGQCNAGGKQAKPIFH